MKYLVKMESIETGTLPPQQIAQQLEQMIIPSIDTFVKMEGEGKILAGGGISGGRAGVAIVEAESNWEVSKLLQSLPFWGLMKVEVTPLQSFEETATLVRENLEQLKKTVR